MTTDLERRALALFFHNYPDADPETLAHEWDTDPELRRFWTAQVEIVLGVQ